MEIDRPRIGDWMQLSDGTPFWPLDPRPGDFDIEVIADHLSKICRFNGATKEFYSVAQHCVLVSYLTPPEHALAGLLHDAWEAYSTDMIRPIKHDDSMEAFRHIERRGEAALAEQFGLEYPWHASVRHADDVALATEKRDLMAPPQRDWHPLPEPNASLIRPENWHYARELFMWRYVFLTQPDLTSRQPSPYATPHD